MAANFMKVFKGLKFFSISGDPASPASGEIWYNSTSGKFRKCENGVTTNLDTTSGAGGTTTTDLSSTNTTVASGDTMFYPNLIIDTGITYTINGYLLGADTMTVNGTLTINGTVKFVTV